MEEEGKGGGQVCHTHRSDEHGEILQRFLQQQQAGDVFTRHFVGLGVVRHVRLCEEWLAVSITRTSGREGGAWKDKTGMNFGQKGGGELLV